jgi:hypothetical protein
MNQESESKGHTFHPDRYLPTLADFGDLSLDSETPPGGKGGATLVATTNNERDQFSSI